MTLPSQSAGHTPGPWRVDDFDGRDVCATVGGIDTVVAECHNHERVGRLDRNANAALIARAPDLLAENSKLKGQREEAVRALEILLEWADCSEEGRNDPEVKQARKVVAKLKEAGS